MYGVNVENVVMCTNQKGNNERKYCVEGHRDRNRKGERLIMLKDFREIGACGPDRQRSRQELGYVLFHPQRILGLLFLVWLRVPVALVVRK